VLTFAVYKTGHSSTLCLLHTLCRVHTTDACSLHYARKILSERTGSVLHWGRGNVPPDLLVAQIQKLADRSDVISEVPKCSKIQILRPGSRWGSLQRSPDPISDGKGSLPLPRTPPCSRPFGPRFGFGENGLGGEGARCPHPRTPPCSPRKNSISLELY